MQDAAPVMSLPGAALALGLLVLFSYFHLRHVGRAILTALAPLPGFVAVIFVAGTAQAFCYLPGFAVASFLAGAIVMQLPTHPSRAAVRMSFNDLWPALLGAFVLIVLAPLALAMAAKHTHIPYSAAATAIACGISAVGFVMLGNTVLSADEDFIVRANRMLEERERRLQLLEFVTQPRWGWSIAGTVLVFSVLGFFGARSTGPMLHLKVFSIAVSVLLLMTFALTRNFRRALAGVLAFGPVALLGMSMAYRILPHDDLGGWISALALAAMPVLIVATSAARFEGDGHTVEIATWRSIERFGASIVFTMTACALSALALGMFSANGFVEAVALVLGGVVALILQPALTTMLYALFPKRISLDEAFRRR